MNTTRLLVRYVAVLAMVAARSVMAADVGASYVEKIVRGHTMRFPLVTGFAPVCEESAQFAERARRLTPATHEFLTCASDRIKWEAYRSGKGADLYPIVLVTVQRPQRGGPFSLDEFMKMKKAAHEQLGDKLAIDGTPPSSVRKIDEAASSAAGQRTTNSYEQQLRGFFDAPSKAPSFSFLTSRNSTITEAERTYEVREVTAISTVFFLGELIQVMVVDTGSSPNASTPQVVTRHWLDSFNALNPTQAEK
jgi:hypothetical protein